MKKLLMFLFLLFLTTAAGAQVQEEQFVLSWQDNSADETGFEVESLVAGAWQPLGEAPAHEGPDRVEFVVPDATTRYRVAAFNEAGRSLWLGPVPVGASGMRITVKVVVKVEKQE